jgi:hypothetical protein
MHCNISKSAALCDICIDPHYQRPQPKTVSGKMPLSGSRMTSSIHSSSISEISSNRHISMYDFLSARKTDLKMGFQHLVVFHADDEYKLYFEIRAAT